MLAITEGTSISLYLHIPFCITRCSYCAFYSEAKASWTSSREQYVDRLEQEIHELIVKTGPFDTIFMGGGNPGCLTVEQMRRLLSAARSDQSREVTIEMNPETFDETFFPLFAEGLVTRLSMGIQSMDQQVLQQLGRNATVSDNQKAIALANKARSIYGIDLSFDLMAALPGQTIEMALQDIDTLTTVSDVEHISLYCLTVEEGTELAHRIANKTLTVLDEDGQMEMLSVLWKRLEERGYSHYEVSNFAKPGRECKHNLVYWNLNRYIGLGSSAASFQYDTNTAWHYSQVQGLADYARNSPYTGYEREDISIQQHMEEYLMMALRLHGGIEKEIFFSRFGCTFESLFGKAVASLDEKWYTNTEYIFTLSTDGWMVLDEIVLRLSLEIPTPLDRHYRI